MSTVEAIETRLWPGVAPGSEGATQVEETFGEPGDLKIRNVVVPTITTYRPAPGTANGTSMVIAPGGGFFMLSWTSEGTQVAEWFSARGVTCFLLKYRVVDTGPTQDAFQRYVMTQFAALAGAGGSSLAERLEPSLQAGAGADGIRALEHVREHADELGLRAGRVGFMGFSAGGFLTTHVAAQAPLELRPDFIAPIYGGAALQGAAPDAPPLFTLVAADDPLCLEGCLQMFHAWRAAGRPAELHVYAEGGHGFGMAKRGLPVDTWIERLADWMAAQGLLAD